MYLSRDNSADVRSDHRVSFDGRSSSGPCYVRDRGVFHDHCSSPTLVGIPRCSVSAPSRVGGVGHRASQVGVTRVLSSSSARPSSLPCVPDHRLSMPSSSLGGGVGHRGSGVGVVYPQHGGSVPFHPLSGGCSVDPVSGVTRSPAPPPSSGFPATTFRASSVPVRLVFPGGCSLVESLGGGAESPFSTSEDHEDSVVLGPSCFPGPTGLGVYLECVC